MMQYFTDLVITKEPEAEASPLKVQPDIAWTPITTISPIKLDMLDEQLGPISDMHAASDMKENSCKYQARSGDGNKRHQRLSRGT